MTVQDKIAHGFGRILAEASGTEALDEKLTAQKAAVLDMVVSRRLKPAVSPWARRAAVLVAGVAAACLIAVLFIDVPSDEIEFFVGDSAIALPEGHFIRTAPDKIETIRFAGGHLFEFAAQTKARVVKSSSGQIIVDVEKGDVLANVVPGSGLAWTVRAGPYEVSVKGTIFSVHWDEAAAVLAVTVDRGKVAVHGPGMDAEGVYLSTGKSLTADSNRNSVTLGQQIAAVSESLSIDEDKSTIDTDASETGVVLPVDTNTDNWSESEISAASAVRKSGLSADWQGMYTAKDFQGILDLAEKKGIGGLKRRLARDELWIVANAARYTRNRKMADDLFSTFRDRFPKSRQSQTAAFLLAKSALEQGYLPDAKRWFEVYASESPDGPLAEEALGRLIQIYRKLGDNPKAVRAARYYLDKYDGGYFTKQARVVVEKN